MIHTQGEALKEHRLLRMNLPKLFFHSALFLAIFFGGLSSFYSSHSMALPSSTHFHGQNASGKGIIRCAQISSQSAKRTPMPFAREVRAETPNHLLLSPDWTPSKRFLDSKEHFTESEHKKTSRFRIYKNYFKLDMWHKRPGSYTSQLGISKSNLGGRNEFVYPPQTSKLREIFWDNLNERAFELESTAPADRSTQEDLEQDYLDVGKYWNDLIFAKDIDSTRTFGRWRIGRINPFSLSRIAVQLRNERVERTIQYLAAQGVVFKIILKKKRELNQKTQDFETSDLEVYIEITPSNDTKLNRKSMELHSSHFGLGLYIVDGDSYAAYSNDGHRMKYSGGNFEIDRLLKSDIAVHEQVHVGNWLTGRGEFGWMKSTGTKDLPIEFVPYEKFQSIDEAEAYFSQLKYRANILWKQISNGISKSPYLVSETTKNSVFNWILFPFANFEIAMKRNSLAVELLRSQYSKGTKYRWGKSNYSPTGKRIPTLIFPLNHGETNFDFEMPVYRDLYESRTKAPKDSEAWKEEYVQHRLSHLERLNANYLVIAETLNQALDKLLSVKTTIEFHAVLDGIKYLTRKRFWEEDDLQVLTKEELIKNFNLIVSDRMVRFQEDGK
jgi:hypothetical protein